MALKKPLEMPSDEGESCVRDFAKDIDIVISCIQEMISTKS